MENKQQTTEVIRTDQPTTPPEPKPKPPHLASPPPLPDLHVENAWLYENCIFKSVMSGVAGFVMGGAMGMLLHALGPGGAAFTPPPPSPAPTPESGVHPTPSPSAEKVTPTPSPTAPTSSTQPIPPSSTQHVTSSPSPSTPPSTSIPPTSTETPQTTSNFVNNMKEKLFRAPNKETMRQFGKSMKTAAVTTAKTCYTSGKMFGYIGFVWAGMECVAETTRAQADMGNTIGVAALTGAIVSYRGGPTAMAFSAAGFVAFSLVIDSLFFPRRKKENKAIHFDTFGDGSPQITKWLQEWDMDKKETETESTTTAT